MKRIYTPEGTIGAYRVKEGIAFLYLETKSGVVRLRKSTQPLSLERVEIKKWGPFTRIYSIEPPTDSSIGELCKRWAILPAPVWTIKVFPKLSFVIGLGRKIRNLKVKIGLEEPYPGEMDDDLDD